MATFTQVASAVSCNATKPLSIMPASGGRLYAVNGVQRGFAYRHATMGGGTVYPIGITAAEAVTASVSAFPLFYYVSSVEVTEGGQNYFAPPTVTVGGVTGAKAELSGGAVSRVSFRTSAITYTAPPQVVFSGGQASGAAATAIMEATVTGVQIGDNGGWYATPPAVTFFPASGVTQVRAAKGYGVINVAAGATSGPLSGFVITDGGEYQYTSALAARASPVGAWLSLPLVGALPGFAVQSTAVVDSVTVGSAGGNYTTPPAVRFTSRGLRRAGGGAAAVAAVSSGGVASVTVTNFGSGYDGAVAVAFANAPAVATAVMAPRLAGRYLCGVRYVDAFGQPGNLCPLFQVDCGDGASTIQWNLSSLTFTDGNPNRVTKAELWRTSADQAITLYRVAEVSPGTNSFADSMPDAVLTDASRTGYGELPILTADGHVNAYRFGVPPSFMSSICMFADRAWYAVDESGSEPSALYFSEAGEPESVPHTNQIVIQSTGRESDRITGMFPMDGSLYICQQRSITRLTVTGNPLENASAQPVAQRGLLNDRCWVLHEGLAYAADSVGLYAFDGSSTKPLSDPVTEFWTYPRMDFQKSASFFVSLDPSQQVIRLHYAEASSTAADRALCYSIVTQAWWTETYGNAINCVAIAYDGQGVPRSYGGGSAAIYRLHTGDTDDGTGIGYSLRTGNYPLNDDPKRGLRLVYTPTATDHVLRASLYYNGGLLAQPFAVDSNPGTGFVTVAGSADAQLNLARNANGFAQLSLAGRLDDRSSGSPRHIAIGLSGTQTALVRPVIHTLQIEGAG